VLALLLCAGAASGLSLREAIEQSAQQIAEQLSAKSRVAIVAFTSPNDNLSEHIMEELTGELFKRGVEVADRRVLPYVFQELDFQGTDFVDEKSAQRFGKILAAQMVITGQLLSQGRSYRFMTSATSVEQASRAGDARFDIENDKAMKDLITATAKQKNVTRTTKYGVNEQTLPQTAGTFLDRGIMFAMRGQYDKAIEDFTQAIRLNSNMFGAYMLRGRALYASVSTISDVGENFSGFITASIGGRVSAEQVLIYDKAIADFTQAIRLDPNDAFAYTSRGIVHCDKGDCDLALADHTQAIRLDPNYAMAYNNRGNTYNNKGDFNRAIADLTQAIKLNPNFVLAYYNRGNAYNNKGDYDRAIADYAQTIKLNPSHFDAYNNRGIAYDNKGDLNRAIADYTQAIKLNPNLVDAYYNRGNAYVYKGDFNRAIADYTQSIKLDPNYGMAYYNRGITYHSKGDADKAIADFTQTIKLNPNDSNAFFNRSIVYLERGDYDRTIADCTEVIRIEPDPADAYINRGYAYFGKKNYDQAIADYEAALRIDPDNALAKENIEEARQKRGR